MQDLPGRIEYHWACGGDPGLLAVAERSRVSQSWVRPTAGLCIITQLLASRAAAAAAASPAAASPSGSVHHGQPFAGRRRPRGARL